MKTKEPKLENKKDLLTYVCEQRCNLYEKYCFPLSLDELPAKCESTIGSEYTSDEAFKIIYNYTHGPRNERGVFHMGKKIAEKAAEIMAKKYIGISQKTKELKETKEEFCSDIYKLLDDNSKFNKIFRQVLIKNAFFPFEKLENDRKHVQHISQHEIELNSEIYYNNLVLRHKNKHNK